MWLVRLVLVAASVMSLSTAATYMTPTGLACFIAIYATWEIGRSIRSVKPLYVNVARGEKLIVQTGATISVPKGDIDRLLEELARQEAERGARA
jgi:hypothetical protein